jgi:hypothetical protein
MRHSMNRFNMASSPDFQNVPVRKELLEPAPRDENHPLIAGKVDHQEPGTKKISLHLALETPTPTSEDASMNGKVRPTHEDFPGAVPS